MNSGLLDFQRSVEGAANRFTAPDQPHLGASIAEGLAAIWSSAIGNSRLEFSSTAKPRGFNSGETMGTANFGIAGLDWQQRVNWDRLKKYRTERAREHMKKHGLGAMLCMYDENVRYLTGTLTPGWNRLKPGLRYALLCGDGAKRSSPPTSRRCCSCYANSATRSYAPRRGTARRASTTPMPES